jgi:ribosomal protein L9
VQRLSEKEEKKLLEKQKKEELQRREIIENRHNIIEKLNGKTFVFKLKTGNGEKIF